MIYAVDLNDTEMALLREMMKTTLAAHPRNLDMVPEIHGLMRKLDQAIVEARKPRVVGDQQLQAAE